MLASRLDSGHLRLCWLWHRRRHIMWLPTVEGNQAVGVSGQAAQVRMVLMREEDPQLPGKPLQKQPHKEDVVVLASWTQLQHVRQQR